MANNSERGGEEGFGVRSQPMRAATAGIQKCHRALRAGGENCGKSGVTSALQQAAPLPHKNNMTQPVTSGARHKYTHTHKHTHTPHHHKTHHKFSLSQW